MLSNHFFIFSHLLQSFASFYLLIVFIYFLAPIQEVDKDLCDPEKLQTVERLVDELSVALSQHFPRMWPHLCQKFCNHKSIPLSLYMCTERMFVFADLSSPALDSSTAHPKVEITHDCRQVYWKQQPSSDIQSPQLYDSQYRVLAKTSLLLVNITGRLLSKTSLTG